MHNNLKAKLEDHSKLLFPSLPDGFQLWAEFVSLDADIVGEAQGIIGQAKDGFDNPDSYKVEIERIRVEAQEKGFGEILSRLDSLDSILASSL